MDAETALESLAAAEASEYLSSGPNVVLFLSAHVLEGHDER
ncbi:MAG: hypothetical protein ACQEP0_00180 [Natrinema limicola]